MRKSSDYVLPTVPSSFRACHHFPFLSIISKISPLENEISLGSSGDAVSMVHLQIKSECETVPTRTCIQRLCLVWVRCVRVHAGISRQGGSTTCTDTCIAWGTHQGRVDALWAACVCSKGALRWYRAGWGANRSGALLRVRRRSWHVHVIEWTATDIRCKAVVVEFGIICTRTDASG